MAQPTSTGYGDAIFNEVENAVVSPLFMGQPLGMSLGNTLYLTLILGHPVDAVRARLKNAARLLVHSTRGIPLAPASRSAQPLPTGKILLAYLDRRTVFRRLVPAVAQALGGDACAVACLDPQLFANLPEQVPRCVLDAVPPAPQWRRSLLPALAQWSGRLARVAERHRLPAALVELWLYEMAVQGQRMLAYEGLLRRLQPRCVAVEHDRSGRGGALVLAARRLGIPTATFFHGVPTTRHAYLPLIADVGLCWGPRHRRRLVELGGDPARLREVGYTFLDPQPASPSAAARAAMGLPQDGLGVLLAASVLPPALKVHLVEMFCQGVEGLPGVWGAVRLHPSDTLGDYAHVQQRHPQVAFHHAEAVDVERALAAADVVVAHNSGLANDALVKRKLAIELDVLPLPLNNGADLMLHAGVPCARQPGELRSLVERLRDDPAWRQTLIAARDRYVRDFAVALGAAAACRSAEALHALAWPVASERLKIKV